VLILSPLAGAARELSGALQVNPYDAKGLAHAMQTALAMPLAERRDRHAGMMEVLRRNDVAAWHKRFLAALKGGPTVSKVSSSPGEHNSLQEFPLRRRI
jgi:trehalose 6-phosphate synthase